MVEEMWHVVKQGVQRLPRDLGFLLNLITCIIVHNSLQGILFPIWQKSFTLVSLSREDSLGLPKSQLLVLTDLTKKRLHVYSPQMLWGNSVRVHLKECLSFQESKKMSYIPVEGRRKPKLSGGGEYNFLEILDPGLWRSGYKFETKE